MARMTNTQALGAAVAAAHLDEEMGLSISLHPRSFAAHTQISDMLDRVLGAGVTTELEDEDHTTWRSWGGRVTLHQPTRRHDRITGTTS